MEVEMTAEEIAKEKVWLQTPLGAAFHKFKEAYGAAWRIDNEASHADDQSFRALACARKALEISNAAEKEFLAILRACEAAP
jgi:hypothetical protein